MAFSKLLSAYGSPLEAYNLAERARKLGSEGPSPVLRTKGCTILVEFGGGVAKRVTIIDHPYVPGPMARYSRRKKPQNYKQTKVETVNVGSAGGQIQLGYFQPIDVEGSSMAAYLNNVNLSVLLNDSEEGEQGGFIAYLTTAGSWDDLG